MGLIMRWIERVGSGWICFGAAVDGLAVNAPRGFFQRERGFQPAPTSLAIVGKGDGIQNRGAVSKMCCWNASQEGDDEVQDEPEERMKEKLTSRTSPSTDRQ
jgi:hypothetical protein